MMKIDIQTDLPIPQSPEDMVGNVYPVRGGFGARNGHVHVIIAHYDKVQGCCRYSGYCTVTVDCDGEIVERDEQDLFGGGIERWANQTDSGQNCLSPSSDRWIERSRTYSGIAKAMAQQWGDWLISHHGVKPHGAE